MLNRWIEDLRTEGLSVRPSDLARRARLRVRALRGGSVERLFTLQADALERVEGALHNAPENMPLVSRVVDAAEKVVARRLEMVTAFGVPEYDELNAKQVRSRLRAMDYLELVKARRYEATHKHRKSVIADIDRELDRRMKPPTALSEPEVAATAK